MRIRMTPNSFHATCTLESNESHAIFTLESKSWQR